MKFTIALTAAGMASMVNAHGYFTSPTARQPGDAFKAACGQQAYDMFSSDINGNIQTVTNVAISQPDYKPSECNFWKCKGMKYADNTANIQKYTAGQTVDMVFHIQAPHTGSANVSIIDLSTPHGTVIAANLKSWDTYASTATPIQTSQENFSIEMPSTLGSKCAAEGACAIQMYWNAPSVEQTYESCIDFTMAAASSKRDEDRLHSRDFSPRKAEQ